MCDSAVHFARRTLPTPANLLANKTSLRALRLTHTGTELGRSNFKLLGSSVRRDSFGLLRATANRIELFNKFLVATKNLRLVESPSGRGAPASVARRNAGFLMTSIVPRDFKTRLAGALLVLFGLEVRATRLPVS